MAKVKITGHASGTGVITVTAPNTSTDRTITLPDSTDTLIGSATTDALTTRVNGAGGRKNLIINGGFDVWQRGTSFTASGYTADRWSMSLSGASATLSKSTYSDINKLKLAVSTGDQNCSIEQKIEGVKATSNTNGVLSFNIKRTVGTRTTFDYIVGINYGSGGSSAENIISATEFTISGTDTRIEIPITFPNISAKTVGSGAYISITFRQDDTATAAYTLEFANFQLELGSVATDFEHRSYGEELALCQRYYQKLTGSYAAYGQIANMNYNSASQAQSAVVYRTEMRAAPSLSYTSTSSNNSSSAYAIANGSSNSGGIDYIDTLFLYNPNTISTLLYTGNSAGGTAREAGNLFVNSTITELALVAEL